MNAVEIEEAVSELAAAPFDSATFPFTFLRAFDNKETTLRRLRSGDSNKSDVGGVLQANNIHLKVCSKDQTSKTISELKSSAATKRHKAKFVLATDGSTLEAEDLANGEQLTCDRADLPDHFGFFLALAGISTVKQVRENAFDIRATSRLNKLYIELLKHNPEWGSKERGGDMNHFMARLIFCFFAEDTDIFCRPGLFTNTVEQMSASDSSNTHEVVGELFRAMNTTTKEREATGVPRWADEFPFVNGGLFSGTTEAPRFSRIARSYLINIGKLDWRQINPDIFGSMIQAVADDAERGELGMHYTSVPNILKVLNPLFLGDLRTKLDEAGDNARLLGNLRRRMSRIRVFDPACGSGNFLVIAYKEMRAIEAKINERRKEIGRKTEIPLTNFRGIELRAFPAEIARLALIIAEYQCDVVYRGQHEALKDFLPLDSENWITCGNALRLDWLRICPPTGMPVKYHADDLFETPLDQPQIDFENEGGQTYICGNPPYFGSKRQSEEQKRDVAAVFGERSKQSRSLDYVAAWFLKAADYGATANAASAFVATNSVCQGQQVPILWPVVFDTGHEIAFAHTSFRWSNLASHKAGVTVVIIGIANRLRGSRRLFSLDDDDKLVVKEVENINAYLVPGKNVALESRTTPLADVAVMQFGNHPYYGGPLIFSMEEGRRLRAELPEFASFIRPLYGSRELINAAPRACLWIGERDAKRAEAIPQFAAKIAAAAAARRAATQDKSAQKLARTPWRFREQVTAAHHVLVVPRVSSENRQFLPIGILGPEAIVQDQALALFDAPLWNLALLSSRLHLVWIATVCGKLKTDFRYSNTLGWNTFPLQKLTEGSKSELTRSAEDLLVARERHFPATMAELYDPDTMPTDLRAAHDRNDEVLERIYIGRRFRNDTERLEKLFELYTKLVANPPTRRSPLRKTAENS